MLDTKPSKEAQKQEARWAGDSRDDWLALSRSTIQFGKYTGQTFKWLLENDVQYTASIVASHQKELQHTRTRSQIAHMANKVNNANKKEMLSAH